MGTILFNIILVYVNFDKYTIRLHFLFMSSILENFLKEQ